jgi:phosphoribosyl 1,2-cyclic phosphate phosphodiesterase
MLQITILGCGSSLGVPVIGCSCSVCKSASRYNKRSRSSIFITDGKAKILVDFGFDIKDQLIREDIDKLDAAILTHDHADHVSGIDNLRVFKFLQGFPLEIITDKETADVIGQRYNYLFSKNILSLKSIQFFDYFQIKDLRIQSFKQHHDSICSLGLRIHNFVYSTDITKFSNGSEEFLHNIDTWVMDCLDYKSNLAHAGLDQVLKWDQEFQPKQIILTNMGHNIDYHKIILKLPPHIRPAYDGMKIEIE